MCFAQFFSGIEYLHVSDYKNIFHHTCMLINRPSDLADVCSAARGRIWDEKLAIYYSMEVHRSDLVFTLNITAEQMLTTIPY